MEKIASFTVDHTVLQKGMYISRVDGDVVTYDIRTRRPNVEEVMDNASIHTVEHLFATFARNSAHKDEVIYFGPMGCRTGFYFLVRDTVSHEQAIALTKDAFAFIAAYEGEIPGVSAVECGNWREHDLQGAVQEARAFFPILADWTVEKLNY
ncbi:MAG: S-ribosylhomocysteine lyase [Clostridia bacterium]|nr:S-ribosylhomocysteine lyase [Clostridia bacterium]